MNCKNHCCNQFGERDLMQEHIDKLYAENDRLNQALNQQITMNADLQEKNMLLRQELDSNEQRVFAVNKWSSRNENFGGYKSFSEIAAENRPTDVRINNIGQNGNNGDHYDKWSVKR